jgi:hypothetical protein
MFQSHNQTESYDDCAYAIFLLLKQARKARVCSNSAGLQTRRFAFSIFTLTILVAGPVELASSLAETPHTSTKDVRNLSIFLA